MSKSLRSGTKVGKVGSREKLSNHVVAVTPEKPKNVRMQDESSGLTPSKKESNRWDQDLSSPIRPKSLTGEADSHIPKTPDRKKSETGAAVVTPLFTKVKDADDNGCKFSPKSALVAISARVDRTYKLINKSTGTLGGNGHTGAIYGELTKHSMQRVINLLVDKCEMSSRSRFIDVGSGLGKPNFHAAQSPAVRLSIGVELEDIRWQLAMHNLHMMMGYVHDTVLAPIPAETDDEDELLLYGGVNFMAGDIDNAKTFDPFTHVYMFDLGFPPPLQQSIAEKFNSSVHAEYLVSYRPPYRVIDEYGYAVEFLFQVATKMQGSGESHTAYFYKRTNDKTPEDPAMTRVFLPARQGFEEVESEVVCDPYFERVVALAAGSLDVLKSHCLAVHEAHMGSQRPKRERQPTRRFAAGNV